MIVSALTLTETSANQAINTYAYDLQPYCTNNSGTLVCTNAQLNTLKTKIEKIVETFTRNIDSSQKTREEKNNLYRKIENIASKKATQTKLTWSTKENCDQEVCDYSSEKTFTSYFVYKVVAIKFEEYANKNITFDDCKWLNAYLSKNKEWENNLRERIGMPQSAESLTSQACLSNDQRILIFINPSYWSEEHWFQSNPNKECNKIYRYNTISNELVSINDNTSGNNPSWPPSYCIETIGKRVDDHIQVRGHKGEWPNLSSYKGEYYFLTNKLIEQ